MVVATSKTDLDELLRLPEQAYEIIAIALLGTPYREMRRALLKKTRIHFH
jgi:hypothetical protein